jgi:hypothetical protein
MHALRCSLFSLVPLALVLALVGCSSDSSGSNQAPVSAATTQAIATGANELFRDPGTLLFVVPATMPGVVEWDFHQGTSGMNVLGLNGMAIKAELALVADGNAETFPGAAYALAPDLKVDGPTLFAAVERDLRASLGALGSASVRIQGGTTSSGSCAKGVLQGVGYLLGGGVAIASGVAGFLTCPESLGAGCVLGAAATATGIGAVTVGAGMFFTSLNSCGQSCGISDAGAPPTDAGPAPTDDGGVSLVNGRGPLTCN